MIPFSVSDILKILEQIPIWKAVTGSPKRVAELERKVAQLEEKSTSKAPLGRDCPICGATMKVLSEKPHPMFGFGGIKIHQMKCPECDNETQRSFEPGKGYT
jgi:hypothetical protein